ncbi:unnamed protein product, partial [Rotaria magnacalcarata]
SRGTYRTTRANESGTYFGFTTTISISLIFAGQLSVPTSVA